MLFFRQILAIHGKIKPGFHFTVLSIGIGEFADEMSFVPSFGQALLRSNISIGKSIGLLIYPQLLRRL